MQSTEPQHWQQATDTLLLPLVKTKRLGLVVDMDGTISYITETPEAAVVTPRNRDLLGNFVLILPLVAAISGREVHDLHKKIAIEGMTYIGNHGLDWQGSNGMDEDAYHAEAYRPSVQEAIEEIEPHLTVGMWVENKGTTASVHYRMTPKPDIAGETLAPLVKDVAEKHGLLTHPGHRLFELRPPINVNKGTALRKLVEKFHLEAVIYIGDDITDLDALKVAHDMRHQHSCYGVGIGVINPQSHAEKEIKAVADVLVKTGALQSPPVSWTSMS